MFDLVAVTRFLRVITEAMLAAANMERALVGFTLFASIPTWVTVRFTLGSTLVPFSANTDVYFVLANLYHFDTVCDLACYTCNYLVYNRENRRCYSIPQGTAWYCYTPVA